MFTLTTAIILATMTLTLFRAVVGPTVYDRILAVNMFTTKTTILIIVMGFLTGRPHFVDIALIYPLLSFIVTFAMLKFFEFGDLGEAGHDDARWRRLG
jgi:multicomponent Na+:H+ antiporter subunit F